MKMLKIKAKVFDKDTMTMSAVDMTEVVVSTKSENNYKDYLNENDIFVNSIVATDFYLDRAVTMDSIIKTVAEQLNDEQLTNKVAKIIEDGLDAKCVFYKEYKRSK